MKKWLGIVLTFIMMLGGAGCAYAEDEAIESDDGADASAIKVSPSGSRLTLKPGEKLEGNHEECTKSLAKGCHIEVSNSGKEDFSYKVYTTPYAVTGSNNDVSFVDKDGNNSYTQIARWIKIIDKDGKPVDEAIFTIKPGETQTVEYQVNIPDDIPGGSQYAVVWAQMLDDGDNSGGIKTLGQVGSVVIGRSSTGSNEVAVFSDVKMDRFAFSGPMTASGHVKNDGNTDFVVNYTYTAKTLFGKEIVSEKNTIAAYPGNEYDFEYKWENTPFLGIFQVEFNVSGGSEVINEKHLVIIMPLIVLVLLILLLTVLVVWIIIIIRKRKERQVRKLV